MPGLAHGPQALAFAWFGAVTLLGTASASAESWYAKENKEGIITFTNIPPSGHNWKKEWKVLFRTGPGKAAATRGVTDRVGPRDTSADRFHRYDQHIRDQASIYSIPESLIRAIVKTESDFDPHVVSSAGAQGLMQLMPATAKAMGVTDSFDPRQNIFGGARYLQLLVQQFCRKAGAVVAGNCSEDAQIKVIAAYHAGPGAVRKYGGMPPYATTREYVRRVIERWRANHEKEGGASPSAPGTAVAGR